MNRTHPRSLRRRIRDWGKRHVVRRLFEMGQRFGFDLLPRHYYSEIPSIGRLRTSQRWRRPYTLGSVPGADPEGQLQFLRSICDPEIVRAADRAEVFETACRDNGAGGYGPVEAVVLYCFACVRMPSRVIQIGAGVSTGVLLAARRHHGIPMEIICIDPHPTELLVREAESGNIELIAAAAQDQSTQSLADLSAGDLLFVDSTHTVKPGSEVNRIILEVLPALDPGVFVHFHDVLIPYDYSPRVLDDDLFFWNETVLIHAFLIGNRRYTLRFALSQLHHQRAAELRSVLPVYRPAPTEDGLLPRGHDLSGEHLPSAAYLEVTG